MTSTQASPTATARPVQLIVRRPSLTPAAQDPVYFVDNDPFISLLFAAFSVSLPEGERFFIQSVKPFLKHIKDPQLQAEIRAFNGQEAIHGTEHERMNALFERAGLDISFIERHMKRAVDHWRSYSPEQQLAITVCSEHFTALMADYVMRVDPQLIDKMHGQMQQLWAWHVVEEAEHKAVCFDVYKQAVNQPNRLRITMAVLTLFIIGFNGANALKLVRQAGETRNLKSARNVLRFMFGKKGILTGTLRSYLDFYRTDFHPWQHDNRKELEEWRERFLSEMPVVQMRGAQAS